ncbi:Protein of unknown function [Paenimyroides ummariense]|uniref:DUF1572 domain-containing protein n=1 Tax=Paenimyroides ummariense TaxID=913024 RepID=A0A1I4WLX5_9FLAO|nr:DUF1572 family protein [Paenimyroides ummariense]SFN14203.1 Protein of unknown function [Paenimyroides ummariense]
MESTFIESIKKQFAYYKHLGDKTFEQLQEPDFFWQFNAESNSIAVIVKHLWGNMLSRWTDIFTTDGEKEWRNRDSEFEADLNSAAEVLEKWEAGWNCLFNTLNSLSETDLNKIIYIRNEGHTVQEAINRQLAHYPYHVGQIVFIGKMIQNEKWQSLSIPRNKSNQYNAEKFSTEKQRRHFTDDLLNDKNQE